MSRGRGMQRAGRALTRPARVVRARVRTLVARRDHDAELRAGGMLEASPARTPIFVLGAPRSGTTLLYQLLVEGLDVGYLANAHCEAPARAATIEREQRPRARRGPPSWSSTHGATSERWEPSECGSYWYRFFARRPHQLTDRDAVDERRGRALRGAVRLFADACGAPVVFKNVFNTLRVPLLARALPEARFVLVERDLVDNARSLLAGRVARGDLDAWWSAEPHGADRVREVLAPAAQVVWQARTMHDVAVHELERHAPGRWQRVGYAELCADPRGTLERIHEALASSGAEVARREGAELPERFERRSGGQLSPELEQQLAAAVREEAIDV